MLIVELNVAGYRLSGEWAGLRRKHAAACDSIRGPFSGGCRSFASTHAA